MTTYDIELKTGDVDSVGICISQNGANVDLSAYDVTFSMKNDSGDLFTIDCIGGGTVDTVYYQKSEGGLTIPFLAKHTSIPGLYRGEIKISSSGNPVHFPSGNHYINVRIWEAIT